MAIDVKSLLNFTLPGQIINDYKALFGKDNMYKRILQGFGSNPEGASDILESVVAGATGSALTGAQREANQVNIDEAQKQRDFEERMSNTTYQRTVSDMQAAGLNPAIMLAGGASGVSTPSGSTASSVSPSSCSSLQEIMSLMMLPMQLKQMAANIRNVDANTALTQQRKLTEEQNTALQAIAVQWMPSINAETVSQLTASVDKMQAEIQNTIKDTDVKVAQEDLLKSQKEAQAITNYYLPSKTLAEINKLDADARSSAASAWYTEIQAKFAKDNGFIMSSNDALLLATYVASIFNLEKSDVNTFMSKVSKYVKNEFPSDFSPWRKVTPDEAIAWYLEHSDK